MEETYAAVVRREESRIPPILTVRSDRDALAFFDLKDLCLAIDEILVAAIDAARKIKINLGED